MIQATPGRISQEFHDGHKAIDIANTVGTPVYAPEAGTVTHVGQLGPSGGTNDPGNVVQIGNEINGHRLCHLSGWTVSKGQMVVEGQLVGYMGFSGYTIPDNDPASSHLHHIMWRNGQRVRALDYVTATPPPQPAQTNTIGDDEVITNKDAHLVRIISSEVKGWPFNHVHSGATDEQEIKHWAGKTWRELIESGWKESEAFRYKRIAAIDYFDNRRPQIEARIAELETQLTQTTGDKAAIQAELDSLKAATKVAYDFVDDARVVIIRAQADKLNLRSAPEITADVTDTIPEGANVAVTGYVTNGGNVNGVTKWYKTLNGYYFTAAYAVERTDSVAQAEAALEAEIDAHLQRADATDWRRLNDTVAGLYEATQTVMVYDYSNQVGPVELHKGMTFNAVGEFKRLGITYLLTDNSQRAGVWRGIPRNSARLIKYDDKLLDNWLANDNPMTLDELDEALSKTSVKEKLLAALGRPFGILTTVFKPRTDKN